MEGHTPKQTENPGAVTAAGEPDTAPTGGQVVGATDADTDPTTAAKKAKYGKLYNLLRQANAAKYVATDAVPAEVAPGLWVGSIGSTKDLPAMKERGITHVLSVGFGMHDPHPGEIAWMGVNIMDTPKADLTKHVPDCHAFIDLGLAGGGGVLVHCHQGKSRSVALAATYLMKTQRLSLEQAMVTIRKTRPQADPNCGFIAQLLKYQRGLKAEQEQEQEQASATPPPDTAA